MSVQFTVISSIFFIIKFNEPINLVMVLGLGVRNNDYFDLSFAQGPLSLFSGLSGHFVFNSKCIILSLTTDEKGSFGRCANDSRQAKYMTDKMCG
jgi:hypothetical protein